MGEVKDLCHNIKSCQNVLYNNNGYVKVIRCKDCYYYDKGHYCFQNGLWTDENDYCSWGAKLKNE